MCVTDRHDMTLAVIEALILNPFPNKPWFLRVCSTSLLKTLWEKEKLLLTSNFPFSYSVFYPFKELSSIFFKFEIIVCKLFQFGSLNFVVWEKVNTTNQSSHWMLLNKTIVGTMDSRNRGTNPVARSIISPRKRYWAESKVRTSDLLFSRTELRGGGGGGGTGPLPD